MDQNGNFVGANPSTGAFGIPAYLRKDRTQRTDSAIQKLTRWNQNEQNKMIYFKFSDSLHVQASMNPYYTNHVPPGLPDYSDEEDDDVFIDGLPPDPEPPKRKNVYVPPHKRRFAGGPAVNSIPEDSFGPTTKELGLVTRSELEKNPYESWKIMKPKKCISSEKIDSGVIMVTNHQQIEPPSESITNF